MIWSLNKIDGLKLQVAQMKSFKAAVMTYSTALPKKW